jgi:hypothetical protein
LEFAQKMCLTHKASFIRIEYLNGGDMLRTHPCWKLNWKREW